MTFYHFCHILFIRRSVSPVHTQGEGITHGKQYWKTKRQAHWESLWECCPFTSLRGLCYRTTGSLRQPKTLACKVSVSIKFLCWPYEPLFFKIRLPFFFSCLATQIDPVWVKKRNTSLIIDSSEKTLIFGDFWFYFWSRKIENKTPQNCGITYWRNDFQFHSIHFMTLYK